jgi:hypothetical protein
LVFVFGCPGGEREARSTTTARDLLPGSIVVGALHRFFYEEIFFFSFLALCFAFCRCELQAAAAASSSSSSFGFPFF